MTAPDLSILDGLTDAQKAVLRRIDPRIAFYPGASHPACRALLAKGILHETSDIFGNPMFRLTPLGLALRTALLETEK